MAKLTNKEMKSLKKQMGISNERGKTFVGIRPTVFEDKHHYTRKDKHKKDLRNLYY